MEQISTGDVNITLPNETREPAITLVHAARHLGITMTELGKRIRAQHVMIYPRPLMVDVILVRDLPRLMQPDGSPICIQ